MFEVPVHFYSLSPARVRRTTPGDGLRAIGTIVLRRFGPAGAAGARPAAIPRQSAGSTPPVR
jgi:hypothetical protein